MIAGDGGWLTACLWVLLGAALGVILYVYVGYAMLLGLAGAARRRRLRGGAPPPTGGRRPSITLIIPAYNEAKVIGEKLENSLSIDYPRDRLEIVVASDGSDDGTDEIVRVYGPRGVKLRAFFPRAGKTSALNRTVVDAEGEIVVLCDSNVMFRPDSIGRLAAHFDDPEVGAVTGDVRIRSVDAPFGEGEGLYYRYERFLQEQESILGSTVTVDGGMYAIRKGLFRALPPDTILDDFIIGMGVALSGHRVIYDPEAVASENATIDVRQEFRRKVRITAGAFRELLRARGVPGPRRPQLFWSYVSHKFLRWLVPWFLLVVLASSLSLAVMGTPGTRDPAAWLLVAQGVFYGCALVGCSRPNARWPAVIGIPFYFCMVNTAAWLGSVRGLLGVERVTWQKADR
ncbi:glycosyltransferase family 2 protein [Tautonia plasticadhaerens]|uniref:Poly-beta-1,6-N-acetyl-D-glucosamine synthase n=1 Tax=Tautonia plasticadhaerens TaxID=2527974 RepID=A0A518HFV3_9BACT|nr:glycosyltransferase family 2 protein [Tautonia plasticadhaerens]QDV39695.1 Poly-beta-1,6-N-acetyl-D-glucosamine synthase [Tautonia plasticadhaerens]